MIIDADAHVEESEAMFDRLDKEFRPRRNSEPKYAVPGHLICIPAGVSGSFEVFF
jgi:hypothetical protein